MQKRTAFFMVFAIIIFFTGCGSKVQNLSTTEMKNMSVEQFFNSQALSNNKYILREYSDLYKKKNLYAMTFTDLTDKNNKEFLNQKEKWIWDNKFLKYCSLHNGKITSPRKYMNALLKSNNIDYYDIKSFDLIEEKIEKLVPNWYAFDKICVVNHIPIFGYKVSNGWIKKADIGYKYRYNVIAAVYHKDGFIKAFKFIDKFKKLNLVKLKSNQKIKKHTNTNRQKNSGESFRRF